MCRCRRLREAERPVNLCRACDQDFGGLELFDRHRVGVHEYTFKEGLAMVPPREDGRRCLDVEEMTGLGWRLNARGRWVDPVRASRASRAFTPSSETP